MGMVLPLGLHRTTDFTDLDSRLLLAVFASGRCQYTPPVELPNYRQFATLPTWLRSLRSLCHVEREKMPFPPARPLRVSPPGTTKSHCAATMDGCTGGPSPPEKCPGYGARRAPRQSAKGWRANYVDAVFFRPTDLSMIQKKWWVQKRTHPTP